MKEFFLKHRVVLIFFGGVIATFFLFRNILNNISYGIGAASPGYDGKVGSMPAYEFFNSLTQMKKIESAYSDYLTLNGAYRFYIIIVLLDVLCFIIYLLLCRGFKQNYSDQELFKILGLMFVIPALAYMVFKFTRSGQQIVIGSKVLLDQYSAKYVLLGLLGAGGVSSLISSMSLIGKPFDDKKIID